MDLNKYIKDRIDPQIMWYDKKSTTYKNFFFSGNLLIIVLSALIPFFTSFESDNYKYIIGFMGVLITILTGILNMFGFYQKWLHYRSTSEKLKSEKYMLDLIADKLDEQEKIDYVQKLEQIIKNENKTWLEDNKEKNTAPNTV